MKANPTKLFYLLLFSLHIAIAQAQVKVPSIYANKLVDVIADTKQGFIQYKLTTQVQIDNLLKGFATMKVTGIRVPIFANDAFQNHEMLDYLISQAKSKGFKIFANPTNGGGGTRIAQGIIPGDGREPTSVLNDPVMTQNLIDRIKSFAATYQIDWIDPFNEDGRVGTTWSKSQINSIYSTLKDNVNGAALIGPCTWGITAGRDVLNNTDVLNYVSIATTHNLDFEHTLWPKFIAEAKGLPVWDSEATNNDLNGQGSRLIAAVDSGVNGVVLYNCWSNISLTNGSVNADGKALMAIYLNAESLVSQLKNEVPFFVSANNGRLKVTIQEGFPAEIAVFDTQGSCLKKIQTTQKWNEFGIVNSGIYLVQVAFEEKNNTRKIAVQ
ncbi:MAG: T9SS type A sorting domain-containing protein [Bacteroidia bacterium]|nr:T9SS type A sorting domain-containing protein [Bacteroidia bacterium]